MMPLYAGILHNDSFPQLQLNLYTFIVVLCISRLYKKNKTFVTHLCLGRTKGGETINFNCIYFLYREWVPQLTPPTYSRPKLK